MARSLKEILSLPVVIDNSPSPVTLTLREGDDWQGKLEELRKQYRLTGENVNVLSDAIQARVAKRGRTLQQRWYLVLASATRPVRSRAEARRALWRTLNGVCTHSISDAFNVVVVLDGFSLESQDEMATMLNECGVDRLAVIQTEEWEGPSSALNRAFLGVIPQRSIVAIVPWGMELRKSRDDDLFLAYERLARSYGRREDVPFYNDEMMESWLAQVPLVVVASSSFSRFDEGFQYFGGIADWLDRRKAIPAPRDWFGTFIAFTPRDTHRISDEDDAESAEINLIPTAPPPGEHERLKQLDADAYHLNTRTRNAAGASSERENSVTQASTTSFKLLRASAYLSKQSWQERSNHMRVAAMICVYDDVRFIEALVEDLLPRIHAAVVLHSTNPWYGKERPKTHLFAAQVLSRIAASPKVSLIRGSWPSEEAQRNFGMRIATLQSMTHVLLVDGDEFWHPVELDRALSLVAERDTPVGWARATMATYWKSTRTVVSPPEPLQILWLVATHSTLDCQFADARNWACSTSNYSTTEDLSARMNALGVFLDSSTAVCHHLSYVRTTSELNHKMTSFAHAEDVRSGWMENIWHRWDGDHDLKNLHPTHPSAFASTINQPLWSLPPALRRLSIRATCDESNRLYCRLHRGPAAKNISRLDLGRRPQGVTSFANRGADGDVQQILRRGEEHDDDDSAGMKGVNWTMISHRHYVSDIPVTDIEKSELTVIADDDFPRCPESPNDGPRFILLIVGEGFLDASTLGVFEDVANVVRDALLSLGALSASIRWCPDLRFCSFRSEAFVIVFGIHHIARYFYNNANESSFLVEHSGWPDPIATVLYNFEQTGLSHDLAPGGSLWRLLSSQRYTIWDYSASNVLRLAQHGIDAQHVPLGYGESLEPAEDVNANVVKKDIDVLFVGRLTDGDERAEVLRSLRERGLNVMHGNSDGPLFGSRLRDHLKRAKIILSLNYWSSDSEWKMTRFLPALALGAVVVSERGGAPEELAAWGKAIVFVSRDEIFDTCRSFLNSPLLREEQAVRGRSILLRRLAADALASPLSRWLRRLCPNWTMTYNQNAASDVWQWKVDSTFSLVPLAH